MQLLAEAYALFPYLAMSSQCAATRRGVGSVLPAVPPAPGNWRDGQPLHPKRRAGKYHVYKKNCTSIQFIQYYNIPYLALVNVQDVFFYYEDCLVLHYLKSKDNCR